MIKNLAYGTGRRKTAVARVFLRDGNGKITVNGKTPEEYYPTELMAQNMKRPLEVTDNLSRFDLLITVSGGGAAGQSDPSFVDRFVAQINDDLNTPRAVALTWELVKSDLDAPAKKATLNEFDRVLGLGLTDWAPAQEAVPAEIAALLREREQARADKRWQEADALRAQIQAAGYEIEDTGQGARLRKKSG